MDIGLIGLGVMGQNLTLNFQSHGYSVVVYNRTEQRTKEFAAKHPEISAAYTLHEFIQSLDRPHRIFLMVTAGSPVDATISNLTVLLSPGDVLIDGGNSHFQDTERRSTELAKRSVHFLGVGVSGGEEGALKGPCLMVGGNREGYEHVRKMLTKIAAQADGPCCQFLGPRGAGHYVKMVHNGIEYAIIQVIAEAYDLLTRAIGLDIKEVHDAFNEWNQGDMNSFLIEIATQVLRKYDEEKKVPLVSLILDRAQQKGTGKWTSQNAMDLGVPIPTIDAAVSARNLSALKDERLQASKILKPPAKSSYLERSLVGRLKDAVQASILVSYAQGFHLLRAASREYGYDIPLEEVARIWKGGCIIRAKVLDSIENAFRSSKDLQNLVLDRQLSKLLLKLEKNWREVIKGAKDAAVPIPATTASLDYYDGYRSERSPANLIQALRDRFGAHCYERIDRPGKFHTDWTT